MKSLNLSQTIKPIFAVTSSLIPVTIAFITGIIWARFAAVPTTLCWIAILLLATRLLIGLRRRQGPFNNLLILPLFFFLGGVHALPFLSPPESRQHIRLYAEKTANVVLMGTLLQAPQKKDDRTKFLLAAQALYTRQQGYTVSGRVLITMPGRLSATFTPGDELLCKVRLSRPKSFGVPGAFDYQRYLANQDIWATAWLPSPLLTAKVQHTTTLSFAKRLRFLSERLRFTINTFLENNLPRETSAVYKALLTGDRADIDPELTERYSRAGNLHLLAISGLHMGLIALLIGTLFVWCAKQSESLLLRWPVWKISALVTLPFLAAYALIAGAHPPVLRALVMTAVFLMALLWNREGVLMNSLAIAALLLLAFNPSDLFSASFQLSFAAVSAIALISPVLRRWITPPDKHHGSPMSFMRKIGVACWTGILISCAASLGTAPLLAWHFHRISFISPLSTLLVEPFLCFWSLPLGILSCLALPFPPLANVLLSAGSWGIHVANTITDHLASLPFAFAWIPTPSPFLICLSLLIVGCFLFWIPRHQKFGPLFLRTPAVGRAITGAFFISVCTLLFFARHPGSLPFTTEDAKESLCHVSVLDVGQGLATVIEMPDSSVFVVDAGTHQKRPSRRFNVGRDLVAPFLWDRGITRLHGIIVSHPDADHSNGLPFLLKHFKPKKLWTNQDTLSARETSGLMALARELHIPIGLPQENEPIFTALGARLTAHNGGQRDAAAKKDSATREQQAENNHSLLVRLTYKGQSMLFPGDIEQEGEERLAASGALPPADVVIAPHHGSKSSSSRAFIEAVGAKLVLISAGRERKGTFPAPQRIREYQKSGAQIIATSAAGSIFITLGGNQIDVTTYFARQNKSKRLIQYR